MDPVPTWRSRPIRPGDRVWAAAPVTGVWGVTLATVPSPWRVPMSLPTPLPTRPQVAGAHGHARVAPRSLDELGWRSHGRALCSPRDHADSRIPPLLACQCPDLTTRPPIPPPQACPTILGDSSASSSGWLWPTCAFVCMACREYRPRGGSGPLLSRSWSRFRGLLCRNRRVARQSASWALHITTLTRRGFISCGILVPTSCLALSSRQMRWMRRLRRGCLPNNGASLSLNSTRALTLAS